MTEVCGGMEDSFCEKLMAVVPHKEQLFVFATRSQGRCRKCILKSKSDPRTYIDNVGQCSSRVDFANLTPESILL